MNDVEVTGAIAYIK